MRRLLETTAQALARRALRDSQRAYVARVAPKYPPCEHADLEVIGAIMGQPWRRCRDCGVDVA